MQPDQLLALLEKRRQSPLFPSSLESLCELIVKTQTREALPWLLDVFLEDPQRTTVLDAIRQIGDAHTAGILMEACFDGDRLKPNVASEVLHCIGALRHPEAEHLLFGLLRNLYYSSEPSDDPVDDYFFQLNTCLGLLHYDCRQYLPQLEDKIQCCLNRNLFNEFLPTLVCKLPEPEPVLKALYWSGRYKASTDCSAGIILGFGLSGAAGRPWLERVIRDDYYSWEVAASGTGTEGFFCLSTRYAGIKLADLYRELISWHPGQKSHEVCNRLRILKALLKSSFEIFSPLNIPFPEAEDRLSLYHTLYTEPISIHDFAQKYDLEDDESDWTHTLENSLLAELASI